MYQSLYPLFRNNWHLWETFRKLVMILVAPPSDSRSRWLPWWPTWRRKTRSTWGVSNRTKWNLRSDSTMRDASTRYVWYSVEPWTPLKWGHFFFPQEQFLHAIYCQCLSPTNEQCNEERIMREKEEEGSKFKSSVLRSRIEKGRVGVKGQLYNIGHISIPPYPRSGILVCWRM